MKILAAAATLALAGCVSHQVKVSLPQTQVETQAIYVPVPPELTAPFDVPERKSNLIDDVVEAYNARGTTIRQCNARLQKISDLGMQP
ncbi:Rz1-like lysis system protein LysC [Dyella mobilis]|uniref:O-spanin n=1 Tax=Dyella mobilis TaxID=1849582 RepID=A0ABS2KK81_9GAMM|nr:hypothetical protein [Dyella mobilis]MBM7131571.1 hypothetical protein [Dyella mobilis]GLQ96457.1 hypothetical protein GCM10007863_08750 [Dyella mobilis]